MIKLFKLTILFFFISITLNAQSVTETINFNNYVNTSDNDLQNHFYPGFSAISSTASPANGITGGCLATADSNNWGNDNAFYCSKFKGVLDSSYTVSLCFKYDSTLRDANTFERPVSIWLHPQADFNHYLVSTISINKTFIVYTYGWVSPSSPVLPLLHNHWYRFSMNATFSGGTLNDQVDLVCNAYNLGLTGTATPSLIGSISGTFNDSILVNDPAISVAINGTKKGGAIYLDDFLFQGIKSADSCLTSGINNAANETNGINYSISNAVLQIQSDKTNEQVSISILNMSGQTVVVEKFRSGSAQINLSPLPPAIYILRVVTENNSYASRFLLVK